jgi:tRNA (guanine-N7-)-methyltransferase
MRLRKKPWAKPELERDEKVIFNPIDFQGKWKEIFDNDFPIHLELGCGRGSFITQLAKLNPQINYIAIDIHPELLVYVLRKANDNKINNLRIIPMYIENIGSVFTFNEIEKIYINFCNPWPNKRHHKRRLNHPNFLKLYKSFLKENAEIWFKTDDEFLFEDSLEYFQSQGFREVYKTYDLQHSDLTIIIL